MFLPWSNWRRLRAWCESLCAAWRARVENRRRRAAARRVRPGDRRAAFTRRLRRPRRLSLRPLVYEGLEYRRLFDSDSAVITNLTVTPDPLPYDEMTAYFTVGFTDTDGGSDTDSDYPDLWQINVAVTHSGTVVVSFSTNSTAPGTYQGGFPVDGFGDYTVEATVTDDGGPVTSTVVDNCPPSPPTDVAVGQVVPPMSATLGPIYEGGGAAFSVTFSDNDNYIAGAGPGGPDIYSYSWVATDDNGTTLATALTSDPLYYYAAGEATHVNLTCTVIDDDDLTGTGGTSFNVLGVAPSNVVISTPSNAVEWQTITLTASFDDFDASSDTFSYTWNVSGPGGAVSGTASGPTYTFAAGEGDGTYNAQFTVTDDDNLSASGSTSFTVADVAPSNVQISVQPASIYEYDTVTLTGSFADPDKTSPGESFTYTWTGTDPLGNSIDISGGLTATAVATKVPGIYSVTLTVTDDDSLSAVGSTTFQVMPPTMTTGGYGIFDIKGTLFDGAVATFDEQHADGPHNVVASIDWGDGQQSAGTVVGDGSSGYVTGIHTYEQEGVYAITVMIFDDAYYVDTSKDYLIDFANSFAKIDPTDEDQFVELAAATGYLDVYLGTCGGSASSGTYSTNVAGAMDYTYYDALTETYGTVLITQVAAIAPSTSSRGTYTARDGSSDSFTVSNYTANDSGTQAFTRVETYADAGISLLKTDTGGGAVSDTKSYTNPYYNWTQTSVDDNADYESGVVLFIAPPPGHDETPEEVDEFLQKLDNTGVVGPFTFGGTDNIVTNLNEYGNYPDGQYTRTTTSNDTQSNVMSGGLETMSYVQGETVNENDTIVEYHDVAANTFTINEYSTNTSGIGRTERSRPICETGAAEIGVFG